MEVTLPGAVAMTRLKVYDSATPDGQRGGTPHIHLVSTELYYVLAGRGAVEMIDGSGFSRVDIPPFSALAFAPGTIHRLINLDGALEILVLMQNSGLPERGDSVACFDEAFLATDAAFADAMRVETLEEAYRRRDRGVEGFNRLKAVFADDPEQGRAALRRFYVLAAERRASLFSGWDSVIEAGAGAAVRDSLTRLDALKRGDTGALMQAQHQLVPAGDPRQLGFCGHLHRYVDSSVFTPEGLRTS